MAKRRGRGRLSNIKRLPREADEIVRWAALELREEERTQLEINREFNEKLALLGLGPISASAFNRHSIRLADMVRRSNQTREIAAVLTDKMQPGDSDNITITLAEMIKTLISELLDKGGEAGFSPKAAMEMASALKSAAGAQKISADRRLKLEAEIATKVEDAVEKVSKVSGISAAMAEKIKSEILGVSDETA